MKDEYTFNVTKDGDGYGAFAYDKKGNRFRLSPTWVREVFADEPQQVKVPIKEKGQMGVVTRLVSKKIGEKLVIGESRELATDRAVRAMKRQAAGLSVEIPKEKKVA